MPLLTSRSAAAAAHATSAHRFEWSILMCVASKNENYYAFFFDFNGCYWYTLLFHISFSRFCVCAAFVRAHLFPVNIINVVVILPITLDTCFSFLMNKRPGTITLIQTNNFSISFSSPCSIPCVCVFLFRFLWMRFFFSFVFQMNFNLALLASWM